MTRELSCGGLGCHAMTSDTSDWTAFATYWLCPSCFATRQADADRARDLIAQPLPQLRRHPAIGAARRIQALVVAGWPLAALADALELSVPALWRVMRSDEITLVEHRRIQTLFARLWDASPPQATIDEDREVRGAKLIAHHHEWLPALAWDDIDADAAPARSVEVDALAIDVVAIELAVQGYKPPLSVRERREAVRRLNAMRWSAPRIAARIGVSIRTIERDVKAAGRTRPLDYAERRSA